MNNGTFGANKEAEFGGNWRTGRRTRKPVELRSGASPVPASRAAPFRARHSRPKRRLCQLPTIAESHHTSRVDPRVTDLFCALQCAFTMAAIVNSDSRAIWRDALASPEGPLGQRSKLAGKLQELRVVVFEPRWEESKLSKVTVSDRIDKLR